MSKPTLSPGFDLLSGFLSNYFLLFAYFLVLLFMCCFSFFPLLNSSLLSPYCLWVDFAVPLSHPLPASLVSSESSLGCLGSTTVALFSLCPSQLKLTSSTHTWKCGIWPVEVFLRPKSRGNKKLAGLRCLKMFKFLAAGREE